MSSIEDNNNVSLSHTDENISDIDKLSKSEVLTPSFISFTQALSPNSSNNTQKMHNSHEDNRGLATTKKGMASSLIANASKEVDTIKNSIFQLEHKKEQFQACLTLIKEKLGVKESDSDVAMKKIVVKIDELLNGDKSMRLQIQAKDTEILEAKTKNEVLDKQVRDLDQELKDAREKIDVLHNEVVPMVEMSEDFLGKNGYAFKKASILSFMKGLKLKQEEMAHIEKMHVDYKQKKIIVEYTLEELGFGVDMDSTKDASEMGHNFQTKSLLEANVQLVKQFITSSNFILYNITDLCRFNKEKNVGLKFLGKVCKELEIKEREFARIKLEHYEKEKERKNCSEEAITAEYLEKMAGFNKSLLDWWSSSYKEMKNMYKSVSDNTWSMIKELQERA